MTRRLIVRLLLACLLAGSAISATSYAGRGGGEATIPSVSKELLQLAGYRLDTPSAGLAAQAKVTRSEVMVASSRETRGRILGAALVAWRNVGQSQALEDGRLIWVVAVEPEGGYVGAKRAGVQEMFHVDIFDALTGEYLGGLQLAR